MEPDIRESDFYLTEGSEIDFIFHLSFSISHFVIGGIVDLLFVCFSCCFADRSSA